MNSSVNVDDFIEEWKNQIEASEGLFVTYLDIPFCEKICKFCVYNAAVYKNDNVNEYVDKLINMLKKYSEIFKLRNPESLYFGGGTPSVLSVKQLDDIFEVYYGFDHVKYKSFEAHPNSMTIDKLDYLLDKGFRYFSFGVQTFNEDILKKQYRLNCDINHLKKMAEHIHEKGGIMSLDLIAYLDALVISDMDYLRYDLSMIEKNIDVDVILIHPNYGYFLKSNSEEKLNIFVEEMFIAVRDFILKSRFYTDRCDMYINIGQTSRNWGIKPIKLCAGDYERICELRKGYDASAPGYISKKQNVLGIGGFSNRKVFSYINEYKQWISYIEKDKDLHYTPMEFNKKITKF